MQTRRLLSCAMLAGIAVLGSGCATIVEGWGPKKVSIHSDPEDADVTIVDPSDGKLVCRGRTPFDVVLERSSGYFRRARYQATFEKPGFNTRQVELESRLSGWYVANLLLWIPGWIGALTLDPATGSMWTLQIDELRVALHAPPPPITPAVTPAARSDTPAGAPRAAR